MSGDLRAFCADPDMRAEVEREIAAVYEDDTYYVRPDVSDVVADVLATVRDDIRDRAEDQARCNKVDDCTAKAVVLRALAEWLEPTS